MIRVETRKPSEGMSFNSLGEPSPVLKRLLLASISELIEDLESVKNKFEHLDYEGCGVGMHKERRYVAGRIDEAAEWIARFLGDIDAALEDDLNV